MHRIHCLFLLLVVVVICDDLFTLIYIDKILWFSLVVFFSFKLNHDSSTFKSMFQSRHLFADVEPFS